MKQMIRARYRMVISSEELTAIVISAGVTLQSALPMTSGRSGAYSQKRQRLNDSSVKGTHTTMYATESFPTAYITIKYDLSRRGIQKAAE
jgi:spore germination protein YaaH